MLKPIDRPVFDCQDFPNNVRNALFRVSEAGNDCYVDWYITDYITLRESGMVDTYIQDWGSSNAVVCEYLYNNGVRKDCIIKHWW